MAGDLAGTRGRLVPDGFWDLAFFDASDGFRAGTRGLAPGSELVLSQLWRRSPVVVEMDIAAAPWPSPIPVYLNDAVAFSADSDPGGAIWRFSGLSDDAGRLQIRIEGERRARLRSLRVALAAPKRIPWPRLLEYTACVLCLMWLASNRLRPLPAGALVAIVCASIGSLVAFERLRALSVFSWLVGPLLIVTIAAALARRWGCPAPAVRWLSLGLALKLAVGTQPALAQPDIYYHAHQVLFFQDGQRILGKYGLDESRAMTAIPYPPGLYAALAPFVSQAGDVQDRRRAAVHAVRWAMAALEASSAFLVLAAARAGGAPPGAAAAAAVAASALPEGMLVILKSVAANIFGSWASLLLLVGILARLPTVALIVLATLALSGHPGATVGMGLLLPLWMAAEARRSGLREPIKVLAALGAGAAIAWFLYYRETTPLLLRAVSILEQGSLRDAGAFFRVRWVHVGKLLQDVVLKFGGAPLYLAWLGLRSPRLPARLAPLLQAWLVTALICGAFALFTPVAMRFEYFALPAIALLAGIGASEVSERAARWTWASSFAIQLALAAAALFGKLRLISLIIPSQRWPFPFAL